MASPFSPNNPGIGGLDELTSAEEAIIASIAALGSAGQSLVVNSGGTGVEWSTPAGGGDVAASANFGTDNVLIRSDGTTKNVQSTGITVDDTDNVSGVSSLNVTEVAAPATPASGTVVIYAKTDGKLYIKDDVGTETDLTSGAGGGIDNVVEDTTPQLGGDLDAQNNSIQNLTDVETDTVTADSSAGLVFRNSSSATVLTLGAGPGTGATFVGGVNTGALGVTGDITVSGTVDGRDIATDGTKLDGVESGADVTDETNVKSAIDGMTLTAITSPGSGDRVLIQDSSDSNNLYYVDWDNLPSGGGSSIEVVDESTTLTTAVTKFTFAGAGVTVTEPATDEVLVTIPYDAFSWEGAWVTATSYAVNDVVENDGSGYICILAHTSGASTEPGVGASWTTNWDLFVEGTSVTEFADNAFRIQDDGDATKEIAFQASGITTATVRTITMPDSDVDLGNVFDKTAPGEIGGTTPGLGNFTNLQVTGHVYADGEVDNGNSGTADTIDWGAGNFQKSTMTGNCTYTFTAPDGPGRFQLVLVQDATGSRTATWPAAVKWPGGTAPTLSTAASAIDIITFYYDGTNYYGVDSLNFS